MQNHALKSQKKSKNGHKRENKTHENLSFFTLAKISLAKISPLKVVDIEAHFFVDVANIDYQSIKVCATTFGPNCQFFLKATTKSC